MAWSRKSAMFAALAIALYLLGLVLRNQQLVTVAVVLLSFLTYAAFLTTPVSYTHLTLPTILLV